MEPRRGDRAGDESYGDQESAEDCSCSGERRMIVGALREEEQVQ
jgi:hypothetical protein